MMLKIVPGPTMPAPTTAATTTPNVEEEGAAAGGEDATMTEIGVEAPKKDVLRFCVVTAMPLKSGTVANNALGLLCSVESKYPHGDCEPKLHE